MTTDEGPGRRALPVEVALHEGQRSALRALFEEAEDSATQLDGYLDDGRVLVARRGDELVGHLQLVGTDERGKVEIKNMAVAPGARGQGIGRRLVQDALARCRAEGDREVVVATAAADVGNLRFYQRCGFRMVRVEPDAFTPETGYAADLEIDGIPLRDRVWLACDL